MDLREKQNLFQLLLESFRLVNRSMGAIVAYLFASVLGGVLQIAFEWLGLPRFFISIFNGLYSLYLGVVLWRLLAAKAEKSGESISNSFSAAIFPSVYMLVFSIIAGVALAGLGIVAAFSRSLWVMGALAVIVFFFGIARLIFAPLAIALREQGPVAAITYSWDLTGKNYPAVIGMLLISSLLPPLVMGGIGYALYVNIPLHFADSFNLAALTPPWYVLGALLGLFFIFLWFSMTAFIVLVFLNRDYGDNRDSFVPLPEARLANQPTQVFGADNNVLPANLGMPVRPEEVQGLSIVKASVKTSTDSDSAQEHLDQVYQQKKEDLIQYEEEDRMPTILFDDDMARQIEENRQMWTVKKKEEEKPNEDNDGQTIKMSK